MGRNKKRTNGFHRSQDGLVSGGQAACNTTRRKGRYPVSRAFDFPGGGREKGETPIDCALRETVEEVGLRLSKSDLVWSRQYDQSWFFVAQRPAQDVRLIRFGDEGQGWRLMHPRDYLANPLAIPNFLARLKDYLPESEIA
ncbi:NUDIX domain-containing protein [uncultured Ruegeria sp.]|uniref:NUDIX domain-containing protein n=1 Tax=uncultured Ruegeria sp. TaxID=259304 RepID=UPI00262DF29D|nr:NUDIX domain-containing protein [uncultured Ruegeria sp.]